MTNSERNEFEMEVRYDICNTLISIGYHEEDAESIAELIEIPEYLYEGTWACVYSQRQIHDACPCACCS